MALDDYIPVQHVERAVGQGIYQESLSQNSPLGTRLVLNDGRVFVYCLNGAVALDPAKLAQGPVNTSTYTNLADVTVPAKGDTLVSLTNGATTIAANKFDDGYLISDDDTGEGQIYKIKSHTVEAAGSAQVDITLYDSIRVACAAATTYSLTRNPYDQTIIQVASGSTQTSRTVGVPLIPVTASYFYWAQTWGDGVGWLNGTEAVGIQLMNSTTAGQLITGDGTLPQLAVSSAQIGIAAEYKPVFWTIAP